MNKVLPKTSLCNVGRPRLTEVQGYYNYFKNIMATRMPTAITINFEEGWDIIQMGIQKLTENLKRDVKHEFPVLDYVNIYTTVYTLCTQKRPHCFAQQLYVKYQESFQEYITLTVLPALRNVHGVFVLREIVKRWENHQIMVRIMSNMFSYLDRLENRCEGEMSQGSLTEVGIKCFHELVYHDMKKEVIELINREREGEQIDRALLRNVMSIFEDLDLYRNDFEASLLEDTEAYYSGKASLWILKYSCSEYMLKAEECLKYEKETVAQYLHFSTEQNLLEKVENGILSRYQTQLLENEHSGCHALLRDGKKNDLSRMYRLFCRIPNGLEPMANIFKQHVTSQGLAVVWTIPFVNIIEFHDKFMDYVVDAFQNNIIFHRALREAVKLILDKGIGGKTSEELLATIFDYVLNKRGIGEISVDQMKSILEKATKFFCYISDTDLFGEFCRRNLARRLLFHKSAEASNEQTLLAKLKNQYGSRFTSKMEDMVTDLTYSVKNQTDFKTYLNANSNSHPGIELQVTVLNAGFWPTYESFELDVPCEMAKCIEVFKGFYSTKHKGRKLKWIYSLGNCNIIGRFDLKPIEITVSTDQAAMLLLFNNAERLSYEQIKSQLNSSDEYVVRLLHSVVCGKYRILVKEPTSSTILRTDYFQFNPGFTDQKMRIEIPRPVVDEKKKVCKAVDGNRLYAIDAAICRIMKSRKVLPCPELLKECVEQLKFSADNESMKKRIENLISRDFLERDEEDSGIIRYLP